MTYVDRYVNIPTDKPLCTRELVSQTKLSFQQHLSLTVKCFEHHIGYFVKSSRNEKETGTAICFVQRFQAKTYQMFKTI